MKQKLILITFVIFQISALEVAAQKPSLNHIALYVVNLKESSSFYREMVGLDTIANPFNDGKHTWFSIGPNSHLHLISGAMSMVLQDKNAHLCFSVPSVDDFSAKLLRNNIAFESWAGEKMKATVRVDGVKQIYFVDPDGYWIEINDARD